MFTIHRIGYQTEQMRWAIRNAMVRLLWNVMSPMARARTVAFDNEDVLTWVTIADLALAIERNERFTRRRLSYSECVELANCMEDALDIEASFERDLDNKLDYLCYQEAEQRYEELYCA